MKPASEKYVDHELDSFIGFFQDAVQQGKKISSKIIQQTIIPADSTISECLEIEQNTLVLVLERIRYIDDYPTCIAKSCIPYLFYLKLLNMILPKNPCSQY